MSQFLTLELGFELAILLVQLREFVLFTGRKWLLGDGGGRLFYYDVVVLGLIFEPKCTKPIGNTTLIEAVLLFGGVLGEVGGKVLFDDTKQVRIAE